METGVAARAVEHGRLEVVEDQVARTAAEEGQGVDQAPVELGLALRQGELDVEQAAIAEHGHEHRDLARGRADLHAAAFAPIDLHRLGRFVMHLLVDAAACRPDLAQVAAQDAGAAGVALGPRAISSRMRTAERSGYLANRSLICSRYGSSTLARRAAWDEGGCSSFRAAATVWREQCSRRAIARPESFSISLRRRISAHKATFMARSSFGQELPRQPLAGTHRRAASALGPVRGDG